MASASPTFASEMTKFFEGNQDGFTEQDLKKAVIEGLAKSQKKTKAKTTRGGKVQRDPDMPKRPKNAFMLFSDTIREEVRAELIAASPDGKIRVADVSKVCGERWKAVSEDDKQPFIEEHKTATIAYKEALEKYYTENPEKKVEKTTTKKTTGEKKEKKKATFSTEDGLPSTPEGWSGAFSGYVLGSVKDPETGKNILKKFADFNEAIAEATRLGEACGGITRTTRGYALRKGSTVTPHKNDNTVEISWIKGEGEGIAVEEVASTVSEPAPTSEPASEDEMPPLEEPEPEAVVAPPKVEEVAPKEEVVAAPQQSNDEEDDDEEKEDDDYDAPTDEEADCVPWEFNGTTYFVDEENDVMTQDGDVIGKRKKVGGKYILKRN